MVPSSRALPSVQPHRSLLLSWEFIWHLCPSTGQASAPFHLDPVPPPCESQPEGLEWAWDTTSPCPSAVSTWWPLVGKGSHPEGPLSRTVSGTNCLRLGPADTASEKNTWKHAAYWSFFSCWVVSDSLQPHGLQHSRPPCPHRLLEFAQTHVCWVGDAIQPSRPLSSPSPPALNLSQYQSLSQWVGSLHQMAKVLELQLQQSFQWIFRVDFCLKRPYLIDTVNSLTPTPQPVQPEGSSCDTRDLFVTHRHFSKIAKKKHKNDKIRH